jgi:hypothetical protein
VRHLLFALLLALAACKPAPKTPAAASPTATYADAAVFAGVYVFAGAGPAPPLCTVTLRNDVIEGAPDVHSAEAGEGCTVAYPVLVALARWEVIGEDAIRLLDSGGYALGDMKKAAGALQGKGEADGKPYTMTPMALFARQAPKAAEQPPPEQPPLEPAAAALEPAAPAAEKTAPQEAAPKQK